jgi:hypothetical protein
MVMTDGVEKQNAIQWKKRVWMRTRGYEKFLRDM